MVQPCSDLSSLVKRRTWPVNPPKPEKCGLMEDGSGVARELLGSGSGVEASRGLVFSPQMSLPALSQILGGFPGGPPASSPLPADLLQLGARTLQGALLGGH